jgi:hypothetical protein
MQNHSLLTETQLTMSGTGHLKVKYGAEGAVIFNFAAFDGCAPTFGYVFGDRELLDQAWHAGQATLAMFGKAIRVKVIGKVEKIGAVMIDSASVFHTLVELATSEC